MDHALSGYALIFMAWHCITTDNPESGIPLFFHHLIPDDDFWPKT
jgi:hypothetical protein